MGGRGDEAAMPRMLKHPQHPAHPVFMINEEMTFLCNLCSTSSDDTSKSRYTCLHCKFNLHPFCATLPPTVHNPHHRNHRLVYVSGYNCHQCNESLVAGGLDYGCEACDYYLHISCHHADGEAYGTPAHNRNLPKQITNHGHAHPLYLTEEKTSTFVCGHCNNSGTGKRYVCKSFHCKFYLHVHCDVEQKTTLRSRLHPQHDLLLGSWRKEHTCFWCLEQVRGGFYMCKSKNCNFVIHPVCHKKSSRDQGDHHHQLLQQHDHRPREHIVTTLEYGPYRHDDRSYADPSLMVLDDPPLPSYENHRPPFLHRQTRHDESKYCFIHPQHDVTMKRLGPRPPNVRGRCEVCDGPPSGDCYSCVDCGFYVHEGCFLMAKPAVVDIAHPAHALHYVKAKESKCAVCGNICSNWRYYCAFCATHVHSDCLQGTPAAGASHPPPPRPPPPPSSSSSSSSSSYSTFVPFPPPYYYYHP